MKWYFLVIAITVAYNGPFDTQEDCLAALNNSKPNFIDQFFYQPPISVFGICFQGIPAAWVKP